ncbi:MAG: nucleotide sugar dehydrogenase [Anaerolineae bacterium]|nr:nucleotide sugar dehydrogenase [Anaerolineae bacterium]MBT4311665.1 nucleotide sugar dehydrogenase [Anaerolineae bacterium]MBT4460248.1 nucleotide sugar dehydrogenase [Anaerolineae bacterium]MBT4843256.1 nucleotide sugar dehydrogenase [Anaerolineae bacterium]MBT6322983.1 nucleotide sugar dehydrogenase [Anaerolineae bacterium]
MKFQKLCVLGLGYIGLPTASTFATNGLEVVGVDVNEAVIATLKSGGLHIHEPGLRTLVSGAIQSGMLRVAAQPEPADAFIIAVPTPFYEDDKRADMRAVTSAAEAITPHLQKGNLVILESTSPPRTTVDLLAPILEKSGLKAGVDFHLAYSPERVLPGQILRELIENARVVGGITSESAQAGYDLYATFVRGNIIKTNSTTAEMVKLMENTTRDVNIAIANEFSRLADRFGVDVWEAISLANLHPRINILRPGPGVGGHCISVDPWFLVEAAPDLTPFIRTAREVNDAQPQFVVDLVKRALGSLEGKKIAALGLAYKPDVDDLRESPAVEVVHLLQDAGASVKAFEPFAPNAKLPNLTTVPALNEALEDADAVILLVAHSQFKSLDATEISEIMNGYVAVDVVNGWNVSVWKNAGFDILRLGVGG